MNKKRESLLNIALGIAMLFLIIVVLIFTNINKPIKKLEKNNAPPIIREQKLPEQKPITFNKEWPIENESEEISKPTKPIKEEAVEEKEKFEITDLKDIPFNEIQKQSDLSDSTKDYDTEDTSLRIRPSAEEIKKLSEKGLIIY